MTVARISKRVMDSFGAAAKAYIVFDRDLTGFGLRVMPSGAKTWIVEYRPGTGGRKIFKRRMKIDIASRMKPDQAREQANEIVSRARIGEDPAAARTTSRQPQQSRHSRNNFWMSTLDRQTSSQTPGVFMQAISSSSSFQRLGRQNSTPSRRQMSRAYTGGLGGRRPQPPTICW